MTTERAKYETGRLTAKFSKNLDVNGTTAGVKRLGLDKVKDGFVYVPKGYSKDKPAALAVMLHGAGGSAEQGLSLLRKYADEYNIILIAPAARKYSWDIIASDAFGPDVIFIDQALQMVFENYSIDPMRVAVGGFSDGASYAFSMGLTNGDLFTHIIAFSPGFSYTIGTAGKPAVYISHGVHDGVLPITSCSRRIVPQLKQQGLNVNYVEFNGDHEIPFDISKRAVEWFIGN